MQEKQSNRRDFVVWSALAFVGVGSGFALWPLVSQMGPNASSKRDTIDIDLGSIGPGQMKQVPWKALPIFVRHRTADEVSNARRVLMRELRDPIARVMGASDKLDAWDENRTKAGHGNWLVVMGACTKESCLIKSIDAAQPDEAFFCPCCASRYDISGRVRSGPAPQNLTVPTYEFTTATMLRVG